MSMLEDHVRQKGAELGHAAARVRSLKEELGELQKQLGTQKAAYEELCRSHETQIGGTDTPNPLTLLIAVNGVYADVRI